MDTFLGLLEPHSIKTKEGGVSGRRKRRANDGLDGDENLVAT